MKTTKCNQCNNTFIYDTWKTRGKYCNSRKSAKIGWKGVVLS